MGREKGYKLSEERIKRMQLGRERRKLGYTRHLHVVEILAEEKMNQLFIEGHLDIEDFWFLVEGLDYQFDPIIEMRKENVRFDKVANIIVGFLESKRVSEVEVVCTNQNVLKITEGRGNVLFVRKKGSEYLVENFKDWW
jgi:hypothetical protein